MLFGDLPEQPGSAGPAGAAPRLRRAERRQVELRAVSLDALVPDDHRVRLVWRFVEGLDLGRNCVSPMTALHRAIRAVEGRPGHPPADPVGRSASNPAGVVAVRHGRGNRRRTGLGPAVRGTHRLPVAVRRGRRERQDPGRLPGGPCTVGTEASSARIAPACPGPWHGPGKRAGAFRPRPGGGGNDRCSPRSGARQRRRISEHRGRPIRGGFGARAGSGREARRCRHMGRGSPAHAARRLNPVFSSIEPVPSR